MLNAPLKDSTVERSETLAQPDGVQNVMIGKLEYVLAALLALCLVFGLWVALYL